MPSLVSSQSIYPERGWKILFKKYDLCAKKFETTKNVKHGLRATTFVHTYSTSLRVL